MENSKEGIIYILSNEAMPELIKIGKTTRDDIDRRMKELYSTGVPLPFKCEYACKVKDCNSTESALHQAFCTDRINPQREFFRVKLNRVIPLLELFKIEDVTSSVEAEINNDLSVKEIEAVNNYSKRRPSLKFEEMGIPKGSELVMTYEGQNYVATVSDNNRVIYNGEEISLSRLTSILRGGSYKYVQPCPYWKYNNRVLSEIYDETYPLEDIHEED